MEGTQEEFLSIIIQRIEDLWKYHGMPISDTATMKKEIIWFSQLTLVTNLNLYRIATGKHWHALKKIV